MGRPNIPVDTNSRKFSNVEKAIRKDTEQRLQGASDDIRPAEYLNERQLEIFYNLLDEMHGANILSNLDAANLSAYAFALTQMEDINQMINDNPDKMYDKPFIMYRKQIIGELQKFTSEFCLSPQSRAKMGNLSLLNKEKKSDPLLNVLKVIK